MPKGTSSPAQAGPPTPCAKPALMIRPVLATLAQLFKALFRSDQKSERGTTTYTPKLIVLFAGIYLLPPPLLVMLVVIPHLVDWVKERLTKSANLAKWYIQPFNIATHLLAGLAAGLPSGAAAKASRANRATACSTPSPDFESCRVMITSGRSER